MLLYIYIGNLNLSRSLGDLKYKQVPTVSKENQV